MPLTTPDQSPWPPLDAQAAIMSGILGTSQPSLAATCSTGNCTWPTTPTTGVCSSCNDVRDQMKFVSGTSSITRIAYTIPLGGDSTNNLSVTLEPHGLFVLKSTSPGNSSWSFPPGRQSFATVWALGVPASSYTKLISLRTLPNQSSTEPLMVAYSCSIYFCLQAYNATSTNGVFEPRLVGSWDQMNQSSPEVFEPAEWAPGQPQPAWTFADIPASLNVANASAHTVDFESRFVLTGTFSDLLNGSVGLDGYS